MFHLGGSFSDRPALTIHLPHGDFFLSSPPPGPCLPATPSLGTFTLPPLFCPDQAVGIFINSSGIIWGWGGGKVYTTKAGLPEDLLSWEQLVLEIQYLAFEYIAVPDQPLQKFYMECAGKN